MLSFSKVLMMLSLSVFIASNFVDKMYYAPVLDTGITLVIYAVVLLVWGVVEGEDN